MLIEVVVGVVLWHVLVLLKWGAIIQLISSKMSPPKAKLEKTMDYVNWSAKMLSDFGLPVPDVQERINKVAEELKPLRKEPKK